MGHYFISFLTLAVLVIITTVDENLLWFDQFVLQIGTAIMYIRTIQYETN